MCSVYSILCVLVEDAKPGAFYIFLLWNLNEFVAQVLVYACTFVYFHVHTNTFMCVPLDSTFALLQFIWLRLMLTFNYTASSAAKWCSCCSLIISLTFVGHIHYCNCSKPNFGKGKWSCIIFVVRFIIQIRTHHWEFIYSIMAVALHQIWGTHALMSVALCRP